MEEITIDYIIEQSKIVDEETLRVILDNFSEQEFSKGADAGAYPY